MDESNQSLLEIFKIWDNPAALTVQFNPSNHDTLTEICREIKITDEEARENLGLPPIAQKGPMQLSNQERADVWGHMKRSGPWRRLYQEAIGASGVNPLVSLDDQIT